MGRGRGSDAGPVNQILFFACVCCCVIIIIIIIFWIIAAASRSNKEKRIRSGRQGDQRGFPDYDNQQSEMTNFFENQRLCNADQRYLPFPTSQTEEDKIIKEIALIVKAKCNFVFFGFRAATDVRYEAVTGYTWASLKEIPHGVLPFFFKKCYEIKFVENGSLSVKDVDNCRGKTAKRLLFLTTNGHSENCLRHPFRCVEIYKALPRANIVTSYNSARKKNPDLLGLVPFDKDYPPESLQLHKDLLVKPAFVMAVKYKFVYKYGTVIQRYTSKRFSAIDPEYDCLGYDIRRDKIVTLDCEDKGCPVCSHHANVI